MDTDVGQEGVACAVLPVFAPPCQSLPSTSTFHLPRPTCLNTPFSSTSRTTSSVPWSITAKLESALWSRYKPLVRALEEPLDQYLKLDCAYKGCMQQLVACQKALLRKNLSRADIDGLLDDIERELLSAQYIALWKRNILLAADKSLYKLTGRKCSPKLDNPTTAKAKKKSKKTVVAVVKENVRRSKRDRSLPCATKIKPKETPRNSTNSIPRPNTAAAQANVARSKRKSKGRENSISESTISNKKRTSGRTSKPLRKKQSLEHVASDPTPIVSLTDEPTYCLCKQISFGDMIGCDNEKCTVEWFHFGCVQLKSKPKGKWYCPLCRGERTNVLKTSSSR